MLYKISVQQLMKKQNGHSLLKDISFDMESGQIYSLLGGSGSGKTTLLRCLMGLEKIDSGNMNLQGKRIGMVLQHLYLWKHLSVIDNLTIAPEKVLKLPKKDAVKEAMSWLEKFNLQDKCHHFPSELSGGEQQRIAIIRSLLMKPDLILMDEPTSALDPIRTQLVASILRELAKNGIMIIIATHDIEFAKLVSDRALFLQDGKIQENVAVKENHLYPKTKMFSTFLLNDNTSTNNAISNETNKHFNNEMNNQINHDTTLQEKTS